MFAIMGATGQTGGHAARVLLERGETVRVVVRSAAKTAGLKNSGAEVVEASVEDPQALARAFTGARGVYVINPPKPAAADLLAETRRVADSLAQALSKARPPHFVLLSSEGAQVGEGSGAIYTTHILEEVLASVGEGRTFLRPTAFMQNWASVVPLAREQGILPSLRQPLDLAYETVSVADIGRVAAELLRDPARGTRIVHLLGPRAYSPEEVARVLSDLLGRPVAAVAPPREAWEGALTGAGLGASYARALAEMNEGLNAGRIRIEDGAVDVRRGTVTLSEALADIVSSGRVQAAA